MLRRTVGAKGVRMRLRIAFLSLILAATAVPAIAAGGPPVAVMSTVNGLVSATSSDNAARVSSYFAPDATVVDEIPPYIWTGSAAGARWWNAVGAASAQQHYTNMRVTLGPIKFWSVTGNSAWVVAPLTISFAKNGRVTRETGLWVLTLVRRVSWLVSSASWATSSRT